MFSKKFSKGFALIAMTALFSVSTLQSAWARPGPLATAPLFLSTIVEPNIFFTHDDSGSMYWESMVREGTGGFDTNQGRPEIGPDGDRKQYLHPAAGADYNVFPPVEMFPSSWIFKNHNGNATYYNPDITYTPWVGTDANGDPMWKLYKASDATAVPADTIDASRGTYNLLEKQDYYCYDICGTYTTVGTNPRVEDILYLPVYYIWNDDGDGVIETTDSHTRVEIAAGSAEMANFVNWWVYYRKREYAAKASIGAVINNTDAARMGLDVFNDEFQLELKTMSDPVNKRALLEKFYDVNSSGGTPARLAAQRVGEMFYTNYNNAILDLAGGGECQQHFNILLSDGFWNGDPPDDSVRDIDNTDGDNNTAWDGGSYADSISNTLADVTMFYYETDLSPLGNNVPTQPGVDDNSAQHLVTYTIAFGLTGDKDPAVDDPTDPSFNWPDPFSQEIRKVDDMWHAAYNGRGKYLNAQNPAELEASLNAAISDIAERTASAAAVSVNSTELTTETVVYLAEFNTNRWQGDLKAYKVKTLPDGTVDPTGELEATPKWSASTQLNARWDSSNGKIDPDREIITYDGNNGIPFEWNDLTNDQKKDLRTSPTGVKQTPAIGEKRLEYIRGSRLDEGASGQNFRERLSLLADLVNSGPVFVGAPALTWTDSAPFPDAAGSRYSEFREANEDRDGVIFAAANDGMLHGFAEETGEEVLAYIPNHLFSEDTGKGMHYLTDPAYVHRYYNDLTPTLSDIYADLGAGTKWQTILVNGLRGGGRAIYALNVNDPSLYDQDNADDIVLWEYTSDDPNGADLGHTYSQPQVALANNGRWVAVFGNGYNDSGSGEAKLFVLDIEGGVDGNWDTADMRVISTGVGTSGDRNGMSTPTLFDTDGDGDLDRVYAGDLYGNMWAFDFSSDDPDNWGIVNGAQMFTTIGGRPITTKPSVALHPTISKDSGNEPNLMVYFGTGSYLTQSDKGDPSLNHFYGVWDKGDNTVYPIPNNSSIVKQTHDTGFTDPFGNAVRVTSNNPVNYNGGENGWYFELDITRERNIFRSVVRGGVVFFPTFVPNPDPCSSGGDSWLFSVDMVNGGSPSEAQTDVNLDGKIDGTDTVKKGGTEAYMSAKYKENTMAPSDVFTRSNRYSGGEGELVRELPNIPTGRFSWQELIQ